MTDNIPVIRNKKYRVADVKNPDIEDVKKADIRIYHPFMDELGKYISDHKELHDHLSWYILEHQKTHARIDHILNIIYLTFISLIVYLILTRLF